METKLAVQRSSAAEPVSASLLARAPERSPLARLQHALGNRGVGRRLQAKLDVGAAHDPLEQEADRIADQVVDAASPSGAAATPGAGASTLQRSCAACERDERKRDEETPAIQRKCATCEQEDHDAGTAPDVQPDDRGAAAPAIRAKATPGEVPDVSPAMEARLGAPNAGEALPAGIRRSMEGRLGRDLSPVRVHRDTEAEQMSRDLGALAFTHGEHIYFGTNRYSPDSRAGQHLLAHEIVHTLQQTPTLRRLEHPRDAGESHPSVDAPAVRGDRPRVQRQEDEGATSDDDSSDWMSMLPGWTTPMPSFGTSSEPGCPSPPTHLGDVPPETACPTSDEEIQGGEFHFCPDSDVFSAGQLPQLIDFARSVAAESVFTVHGYASEEGTRSYNLTLSCHRAKRAARELINAGVRSERIRIAAKGQTRRFSDRDFADARAEAARSPRTRRGPLRRDIGLDRVVVIRAASSGATVQPEAASTSQRTIVNQARALFANGMYRLGADAYLSYWSCGLVPSLARAVELMTIRIEGEDPRFAEAGRTLELGTAEVARQADPSRPGDDPAPVPNEIVISEEAFSATNPLGCVAARIADMTFHHMVRHVIAPQSERHAAALFFVDLAGLPPCESAAQSLMGTVVTPARSWWQRPATDPRQASAAPPCAPAALPGALAAQPITAAARRPLPTFQVDPDSFQFDGGSGPVQTNVVPDANLVEAASPSGAFHASAHVTATGDPAALSNYRVGFLQTIVADEELVDYVDGHRVRVSLPVPIRDGPPQAVGTPWFDSRFVSAVDPSTRTASATLSDSPMERAHYQFVHPELINRPRRRGETLVQEGNVLNRAVKRTTFKTWLAARRNDASADPFSTVFLEGRTVTWEQNVDLVGTDAQGTFSATVGASATSDTSQMQLRGPTPADFLQLGPMAYRRLQTEVLAPTPRAQAQGLGVDQYRAEVRRTADLLEPYRRALGLTDGLVLRLHFDLDTGRLVVDPQALPIRVCFASDVDCHDERSAEERRLYAHELLTRLRKDLIHAPQSGRYETFPYQIVSLPAIAPIPRFTDPFSPAHGLGLVGTMDETARLAASAASLARDRSTFNPDFMPDIRVSFRSEQYRYDFSISDLDLEEVCTSHELVAGCTIPEGLDRTMSYEATPSEPEHQTRDGTEFVSPLRMDVTFSPVRFTIVVPGNRLHDGDTVNHELSHVVEDFQMIQIWKDRLARTIRARAMETRRDAVAHPEIRSALLDGSTLRSIAAQEIPAFIQAFGPEYTRRHDIIDSGRPLPPVVLPSDWTMPQLAPGARGSLR